MTTLPAKADLTGGTITEGQFKTSMNDLIDFLSESIGTTGGRVEVTNAGTASAPSIAIAGDTNTGIYWPSADTLGIATGGSKRVTVDGSGNVGIGIDLPQTPLDLGSGTGEKIRLFGSDTADDNYSLGVDGGKLLFNSSRRFVFTQGTSYPGTEIAQLNDNGSLLVGTTSEFPDESTPGIALRPSNGIRAFNDNDGTSVAHILGGSAGYVHIMGDGDLENTNGNYGTISDPRLKQDVTAASSQWDDVKELGSRFVNYRLKDSVERQGDDAPTLLSVLADDDFATRFPGLTKTDAETGYRSFKQSVASMKGLVALSEALERIEALEARLG